MFSFVFTVPPWGSSAPRSHSNQPTFSFKPAATTVCRGRSVQIVSFVVCPPSSCLCTAQHAKSAEPDFALTVIAQRRHLCMFVLYFCFDLLLAPPCSYQYFLRKACYVHLGWRGTWCVLFGKSSDGNLRVIVLFLELASLGCDEGCHDVQLVLQAVLQQPADPTNCLWCLSFSSKRSLACRIFQIRPLAVNIASCISMSPDCALASTALM